MRRGPSVGALAASLGLVAGAFAVLALHDGPPPSAAAEPEPDDTLPTDVLAPDGADDPHAEALDGPGLLAFYECNRCHEGPQLAEPAPDKACVGCHARIQAGTFEAPPDVLKRWQADIVHLTVVPSLTGAEQRFRRDWLVGFLQRPHDLRPRLDATMPRMDIPEADAKLIAATLVPDDEASERAPGWAFKRRGRAVFQERGCGTCHQVTGVFGLVAEALPISMDPADQAVAMKLAPDLRHVRERFQAGRLVDWILDPKAIKADTTMPKIPMSRADAEDIAAFLLELPLATPAQPPVPKRLPVLTREVSFEEVQRRVFKKTCWHCHSEPDLALGDGGPGNTGGFGFEGRGLSFVSYQSTSSGSLDDDGKRRSIFAKMDDGTPRVIAHLMARHAEVTGRVVDGVRGMPLGLPPLPLEDIQLVESWIVQGRPR